MSFVPAQCKTCEREIQVPNEQSNVKCMFCGADVNVKEAISLSKPKDNGIINLLSIADAAYVADNLSESYDYYNKILEIDSKNIKAWIGKGRSAGWQSTIAKRRLDEMVAAFNKARELDLSSTIGRDLAKEISSVSFALSDNVMEHYTKNSMEMAKIGELTQFQQQMTSVTADCLRALASATKIGELSAGEIGNAASRAHVCFLIFEGKELETHVEYFLGVLKKKHPTEYEKINAIIAERDRSHAEEKSKNSSSCFVVTATLGNQDNMFVTDLRYFRDNVLASHSVGSRFISWYYRNGPAIASIVSKSIILRMIAFVLVVLPVWLIIRLTGRFLRSLMH